MKQIKLDEWVKISTYAKKEGLTVQAIYKQAKKGQVETIDIDGVTLVRL